MTESSTNDMLMMTTMQPLTRLNMIKEGGG
jgi:hypothetical protein